jgi:hypothetical protein
LRALATRLGCASFKPHAKPSSPSSSLPPLLLLLPLPLLLV